MSRLISNHRARGLLIPIAVAVAAFACGHRKDSTGSSATGSGSGSGSGFGSSTMRTQPPIELTGGALLADPALVTGKLANGLTYYVLHNAKPEKRVELWLAVNAGSVLEDDDQRGVAHFVEHMAFNGTKKYAKQEIVSWLEKIGMKFGADVNARTTFDDTVYQIQVPTDDPTMIAHGLDVLHEWAQGVAFDPTEVDKERGVVLEERRLGRGAQGRLLDAIVPAALPGSKYGQRLPIGLETILKTATPDTLKRFYHDWYRPDLMAVIVVGDVDPAKLEQQVKAAFGDLVAPEHEKPRPDVAVPDQDKAVTLSVNDPELPISVAAVASKQTRRVDRDEADVRADLVDILFTQMLNQRLEELAKKDTAPFMAAALGKQSLFRPIDVWFQGGVVKGDRVTETLEVISTELARVSKFGFLDSEITRAKEAIHHQLDVRVKEQDKRESSERVEELVQSFLKQDVQTSAATDLALADKYLPTIKADELQAVATRAASDHNRVVIAAGNAKTKLPKGDALLAAIAAGKAKATTAYVDDAARGPLVASPPKPGTIASENTIAELGVTEWVLSNGIKVVIKPTDFQNDHVGVAGFWLGGTSVASDADYFAALASEDVIEASGAGTMSAVQLDKALNGTGVKLRVSLSPLEQSIDGSVQPDHFEQLLQLVYLRLTTPRKDDAAIAAWRDQQVQARKHQLDDPATVFAARFQDAVTSNHPRYRLFTSDDFAKLDVARSIAFYQDRIAHLGGLTFVIVGNVSLATIKPLILTYLGGLTVGPAEPWQDRKVTPPPGIKTFEVKQGLEPKAAVHLQFHTDLPWSRQAEFDVQTLAQSIAIPLREELREGMSGTYGVGVSGAFRQQPTPRVAFDIQFGCAPENVDALIKAAMKIVGDFQTTGPASIVVDKIKETRRRSRETSLKDNTYWLASLRSQYRFGQDPKLILADLAMIDAISVASLRDAAKHYLGKDYVLGVLRPAK